MKGLRLLGKVLLMVSILLFSVLLYEEIMYNFNYYYKHHVNFFSLFLGGLFLFMAGYGLVVKEE